MPGADKYFDSQKKRTTYASKRSKIYFFKMMQRIGDEIQRRKRLILPSLKTIHLQALDIYIAPGGYSSTILKYNSYAKVCGLRLPIDQGGYNQKDKRVTIKFIDITILAVEIGFPNLILQNHPQASQFSNNLPFQDQTFNIMFCDR
ncbi:hypothetical protein N7493_009438 [Penicillium malachiteum]|uniref:Ribosomal RNA methyltransferase FtsJ domain-containing protein n=1 Tax=Penicillium malachiteum TaxID=1324776 RepID=A0AAD6HE64_9EURO|nr:hypothetical protein N7493_009438 [Penicillium malachiteum]